MKYKTFKSIDGRALITRISGYIEIKTNYNPGKNNHLWDYVRDDFGRGPYNDHFNDATGLTLDYFTYKGRNYAIGQFYRCGTPWLSMAPYEYIDESGYTVYIGAMDYDSDIFCKNPLFLEVAESGDAVRLYHIEEV